MSLTNEQSEHLDRPLTHDEKVWVFRQVTNGYSGSAERWAEYARTGLTDDQLSKALARELGIYGGFSIPDGISAAFQGSGLKIWASWSGPDSHTAKPVFQGAGTVAMARMVYGIRDPGDHQLSFL